MKKIFLTLTVILLSISFYPVKAMEKTADILKKNVVTSGDGLYVDSTIDGRYIYKGGKPNNYIKLGDDLYRIISIEKDGTIKVIKQESIGDMAWDEENARYSTNSADFCSDSAYGRAGGCKVWGSNTTTLDTKGNKVATMPWNVYGTYKNLPDNEATLSTYLNNEFYNGLSDDIKSLVVEKVWNVGPTYEGQARLSENIEEESLYKWKGKIALMNATDYVKSSTNSKCTTVQMYWQDSSCYRNSSTYTYLYSKNYTYIWTISPRAQSDGSSVFYVHSTGSLGSNYAYEGGDVRPAFFLSSETTLNGEGTETNPYTISKYIEEPKNEENKGELNIDNGQIVEVPSTSAQMSIIIASIGIIFVSLAVIITKKMTKKKEN